MNYIRLFSKIVKYNLNVEMQYRTNFLMSIPLHLSWTLKEVVVVILLYAHTTYIYGWGKYEYILLLGTYFIADSFFSCILLPNISKLSTLVKDGSFDYILLKPVDSQFMVLTYSLNISVVSAFIVGIVLVMYSVLKTKLQLHLINIFLYIVFLISGIGIFSWIMFICATLTFKYIQTDFIRAIFITVADMARKPVEIFPHIIQILLVAIPIVFISYVPTCVLLGKISIYFFLGIPGSILLFMISRYLWKRSLRNYNSAN